MPSCKGPRNDIESMNFYQMDVLFGNDDWSLFSINNKNELYYCYQISNGSELLEHYELNTGVTTSFRLAVMDAELLDKLILLGDKKGDVIDGTRLKINLFDSRGRLLKHCSFTNGFTDETISKFIMALEVNMKYLQGFTKMDYSNAIDVVKRLEKQKTLR
jgi:hypothetical protein